MNLRKLELSGFKTFARRTEVPLPGGVTAIVGPNGSGKSNLADALRWVLGEQSMQSIRSKKTEDVIFAGSSNRPALGMAEVILTLDNTSGWIPLDFSEVTITRRAHRSGENDYFINGTRVRLRDVVDLRNRAGFGQSSYSVIGQGLIDQVLSQRPDERRALFEEAAGIRHYQTRRDQTLDQLAATQQNLVRVTDIIAEISPRLNQLRQQAEKALKYQELSQELRTLQIRWFAARQRALAMQVGEAERQVAEAQRALQTSTDRLQACEQQTAALNAEKQALEHNLSDRSARLAELEHRRQQAQGQIDLLKDKLTFMEQQGGEAEEEMEELAQSQQALTEERRTLSAEMAALAQAKVELEKQLELAQRQANEGSAALKQLEQANRQTAEELARANAALAQRQQEITELDRRTAAAAAQTRQHEQDIKGKSGLVAALEERVARLTSEIQAARADEERVSGRQEELRLAITSLNQRLAEERQALQELERKRHEVATRLQLIQELEASFEGLGEATKTLLASSGPGILGAIAEHLQVEPGFERAIAAALGHKLEAVLVADARAAIEALAALPESGGTLAVGPWESERSSHPALPDGFVWAESVVRTTHPAVAALLAGVALAPDAATALAQRSAHFRIATRDGDVLDRDGTLTRRGASSAEAVLKRRQALRDLEADLAEVEGLLAGARARALETEHDLDGHSSQLREVEAAAAELARARQQRAGEIRDLRQQQQSAKAQIDWMTSLSEKSNEECKALDARRTTLLAQLDQLKSHIPELRQAASIQERELAERREGTDRALEEPSRLRLEIGVTHQRVQHLQTQARAAEQNLANIQRQQAARQQRISERAATVQQLRRDMDAQRDGLAELEKRVAAEAEALQPLKNRLATVGQEFVALRSAEAAARDEQVEQDKRSYRCSFEAQRKRDEIDGLTTLLWDELQLTPDILPEPDPSQPEPSKREVDALRGRLASLGPINPSAMAEFQEAEERHSFLTSQSADLEQAAAHLNDVIRDLEDLTNRQFRETFEAVAVEFQRHFQTMFNGGQVQLFLTDPDDVTRSGVEIMAQPPGKRLQNLSSLSGGERALVAASLLFAILTVKPVPFCLLDEVDAALDEANVARFCQALRTLAQQTQFVLITHNRETMAMADAIYGVSMNQDGVSRLVSMRLAREEPASADEIEMERTLAG